MSNVIGILIILSNILLTLGSAGAFWWDMNYLKSIPLIALLIPAAYAQSIYQDFDSYSNGVEPDGMWTVQPANLGNQTVLTSNTHQSPFTAGVNGVNFIDNESIISPARLEGDISGTFDSGMGAQISFDMYTGSATQPSFQLRNSTDIGIQVLSTSTGWKYNNGSGLVAIGSSTSVSASTWYHIEITSSALDTESDTFDITIYDYNGGSPVIVAVGTDLAFRNNIDAYAAAWFTNAVGPPATGQDFAIDNFSMSQVPESSSYSLIAGLLGLGLFLVRRRKGQ